MTKTPPAVALVDARVSDARPVDGLVATCDKGGVEVFGSITRGVADALAPPSGERVADVGSARFACLLPAALLCAHLTRLVELKTWLSDGDIGTAPTT